MKIFDEPASIQAPTQFIVESLGRVVLVGIIVGLVSMWALIEPFYEVSRRIAQNGKIRKQISQKGKL